MPIDFIKTQAVKDHTTTVLKLRSTAGSVDALVTGFNKALEKALAEAATLAKKANRTTLMESDVATALEKVIGKTHLTWQETAQEVTRQDPTALGQLAKAIRDWITTQGDIRPRAARQVMLNTPRANTRRTDVQRTNVRRANARSK